MGDIPIIWSGEWKYNGKDFIVPKSIYITICRKHAEKDLGLEPEEVAKKFYDLCTDFGLDIKGKIIPDKAVIEMG